MILRALWLRPTRRAPARFLATVLGVALGVASVVATLTGSRAAVASFGEDALAIAGRTRLELTRAGGLDENVLGVLSEYCDRFLVAPVVEETARLTSSSELVRVLGVDLLVDAGLRPRKTDTSAKEPLSAILVEDRALLPRELAEPIGLVAGDDLELLVNGRHVRLKVARVFEPERFGSAWRRVVVLDVALAQELFGRVGRLDRIEMVPRVELDLTLERERLARDLPAGIRVAEPETRLRESARAVQALEFNLGALSGISVLVGLVLVATTLATSIRLRRGRMALLRSLGASRSQLARAVLVEAGTIGLAGGGLGVLIGAFGARFALMGVRGSVASVAPDAIVGMPRLTWTWALLGLGLGLGASLGAALLPLREAISTPPLQGLRGRGEHESSVGLGWRRALQVLALVALATVLARLPALGGRPIFALCASLALLGTVPLLAEPAVAASARLRIPGRGLRSRFPLHVAQAALATDTRRVAWAAGAAGIAIALSVSMTTMIGSFRATVVDWTREAMGADLSLRPLPTVSGVSAGRLDPEVERVARELYGAEHVDPFHSTEARVDAQSVGLSGAEFAVAARHSSLPFLEGGLARDVFARALAEGGVVVNEPFANRFDRRLGDPVTIETSGGTIERTIAGVYVSYSNPLGLIVLDNADYLALQPDEGAQTLAIYLPDGAEAGVERERLLEQLGADFALDVLPARELRADVLAVFDRTFAVTAALELVAMIVAVLAVALVLFARVSERRAELGVVRVLGGSRLQLAGIVSAEATLLGVAGAASGGLVGLVVGWILVRIVNLQSFGWTLRFLPPWPDLLHTLLLVLPATLLAGLIPAWKAMRLAPSEVLHGDRG